MLTNFNDDYTKMAYAQNYDDSCMELGMLSNAAMVHVVIIDENGATAIWVLYIQLLDLEGFKLRGKGLDYNNSMGILAGWVLIF